MGVIDRAATEAAAAANRPHTSHSSLLQPLISTFTQSATWLTAMLTSFCAITSTGILRPPNQPYTATIIWQDCSVDPALPLRCANTLVPLDWSDPRGEQISLAMSMIPAANQTRRIGYLFVNPGGPGGGPARRLARGPASDFLRSSELHELFDIIGPDPRGTGFSNPIRCDPDVWNERVSFFPSDEASYDDMVNTLEKAGQSCAEASGKFLNYVDTVSTVRDFEAIRVGLGGEPFNYLGFSYGSQLGSQYAELFPDNIRAMVLDGILDHSQDEIYSWTTEIQGYEATMNQFFEWCVSNDACALHNETDLADKFDKLIDQANASPIPAPGCDDVSCRSNVTGYEMLRQMQPMLVFPYRAMGRPAWQDLAVALYEVMYNNNATTLSEPLATSENFKDYSFIGILCQDWNRAAWSAVSYMNKMLTGAIVAPHTRGQGEFWYAQARCMRWPAPTTNSPHSIAPTFANRTLSTPILLVNAFFDPETAYPWALSVLDQFGTDNAVLVSRNGSGHTSYYLPGATQKLVDKYLIKLETPVSGTITPD